MSKRNDKPIVTKEQAREYLARWRLVDDVKTQELRAKSAQQRFDAYCKLFEFGHVLGWTRPGKVRKDEEVARERWNLIRRKLGDGTTAIRTAAGVSP